MIRFAFYGRVSTDDNQEPESSRQWQRYVAEREIAGHGEITVEYFDIDVSRAAPWTSRPQSRQLLIDAESPGRLFDAVVIAEAPRAFYGNQWADVLPRLRHYGVEFWIPELGGLIDPTSTMTEMMLGFVGGMSKDERRKVQVRVKNAMTAQTINEGRFLGSRPLYGYQLVDVGPHPNPSKASMGAMQHALVPNPSTAPIVKRIFRERLAGAGYRAIAAGLTRDGIPPPSEADPERNRSRQPVHGCWGMTTVRSLLENPKYTGFAVWNRQQRTEILVDPHNPSLGHRRIMRWNDPSDWVWSREPAHEPLVTTNDFQRAQVKTSPRRTTPRTKRASTYRLRGLVMCAVCGRRMNGQQNHGRPHYCCKYRTQFGAEGALSHPKTVYLREDRLLGPLVEWLMDLFDPTRIDHTVELLAAAALSDHHQTSRKEGAERKLETALAKICRSEQVLEAGGDPTTVATWLNDARAAEQEARLELASLRQHAPLTANQIRAVLDALPRHEFLLSDGDPVVVNDFLHAINLTLTYDPVARTVTAECDPCGKVRVGGPSEPNAEWRLLGSG
jgi:site-specific DNA recombinase